MPDWKTRLAIVSDEAAESFTESVNICLPLGIRAYELRKLASGRFPDVTDVEIDTMVHAAQTHALTLIGVSPGFFKWAVGDAQTEEAFARSFPKTLRLMDQLGVRRLTVFSFQREGDRSTPIPASVLDYLGRAAAVCQREGVLMLIENSASTWGDTGANLASLAQMLAVPVTWDPGNAAAAGEIAYPNGYHAVRDHIAHVHFKNWLPGVGNVAITAGIVDMVGQVAALQADGYSGYYCIEPHQWHDRINATRQNTQQLLGLLQKETP
jgi:L-ribulose-5-phosphate 3-epimerase